MVTKMFNRISEGINSRTQEFLDEHMEHLTQEEDYADQMQEQLSNYLIHCSQLPLSEKQKNNVSIMIRVVDDLENMTDDCYSVAVLLKRSIEKNMIFANEDMERLLPYMDLAHKFLEFIRKNINKHLSEEDLRIAQDLENQIDKSRSNLKKVARKRLESGADVKTELLYIDLVRSIEKLGDRAFSISEALSQTE